MVSLILGLRALPGIRSLPQATIVPAAVAIIAFAALIWAERRHPRPLLDFNLLSRANLIVACEMAFVLMFGIMTLLLYYNLYAQAPEGLGMSAIAAGISLLPLSVALFGFARAAPRLSASVGVRRMLVGGWLILALGCLVAVGFTGRGAAGDAACRPVRDWRWDCAALCSRPRASRWRRCRKPSPARALAW